MTDLLTQPFCKAEHLGRPLPDSEFGVSVCLPRWSDVIGYEEKDPEVLKHFRSGYPRFCCPPAVGALFEAAEADLAAEGERCLVFPRVSHAERCLAFIERQAGMRQGRAEQWTEAELGVAVFPDHLYEHGRRFWRFCGEIISTRQAREVLAHEDCPVSEEGGREASRRICRQLAELSGQQESDVFLFPSGMAANYAVHRMLTELNPERRTVQLDFPYVDVLKLQEAFGSGVEFLPLLEDGSLPEEALVELLRREQVAGVFCEAPSNPLLRCADLPRLMKLLEEHQPEVPLVIDDTVGSLVNVDAFRYADIVTSSLTKSFSGVGDVLAGSVILNRRSPHHAAFSAFLEKAADHELWKEDAVALEANARDFVERVQRTSRSAQRLADYLRSRPEVEQVWYADREGGAGYEAVRREEGGYGCLLSFVLRDRESSPALFDAIEFSKGPSLGANFTLLCPYTLLAHYEELGWAESCGVPRELLRVSVGLEDPEELVRRLEHAFASLA